MKLGFVLLALLPVPACAYPAPAGAQDAVMLAITDVAVLDVAAGRILPGRTILLRGDRITWVGAAADAQLEGAERRVSGTGLVAMPGLVDLHAHLDAADLPLFLANGVTTVREMNGSPEHLALREEVRGGSRLGPTLVVASPLLAGTAQRWRHELVESADAARAKARELIAQRYDYLKIYDGLSAEAYAAIVEEGRAARVPLVGHIPREVGLDGVLAAGQAIEHVEQLTYATVGDDPDTARAREIAARVAAAGVPVAPTLAAMEILSQAGTQWFDALFDRPHMRYADPSLMGWWSSLRRSPPRPGPSAQGRAFIGFMRALTRELAIAGVPILIGTDTPNPLLVPGFSVAHELAALERAGLSPGAILRAATLGAAEYLGVQEEVGEIAPGRRADLVLLRGDPLASLDHVGAVEAVVVRGRILERAELDTMLESVAAHRAAP